MPATEPSTCMTRKIRHKLHDVEAENNWDSVIAGFIWILKALRLNQQSKEFFCSPAKRQQEYEHADTLDS